MDKITKIMICGFIFLVIIIICINLNNPITQRNDSTYLIPKILPVCDNGKSMETSDDLKEYKIKFTCLGEMKSISGNNIRSILLTNNNVLLYQKGKSDSFDIISSIGPTSHDYNVDVHAELYDTKRKQFLIKFDEIPTGKGIEEGFNYDYIK